MSKTIEVTKFDVKTSPCPTCGRICKRHTKRTSIRRGRKGTTYSLRYSTHFCPTCDKFFTNIPKEWKRYHYAPDVREYAASMYRKGDVSLEKVSLALKAEGINVPTTTLHDWVVAAK